jgi:hypothetical protein
VPVRFARGDKPRLPEHWCSFGGRHSPLTGSPRRGVNPANAMLNYLYAILEAEARLAALAVGLDPALGIAHADQRSRDSLACDLMEPIRPVVDGFLLRLLEARTFRRSDFFETREGVCRVLPPVTHLLAGTSLHWAAAVGPVAEHVARVLYRGTRRRSRASDATLPTPLTETNRSAGRAGSLCRSAPLPMSPRTGATCRMCGAELSQSRGAYCTECWPRRRTAQRELADVMLANLRRDGRDPAHGGEAGARRGARVSQQWKEIQRWRETHGKGPDRSTFEDDVWPLLRHVAVRLLMRATGLSRKYCAFIRNGDRIPHPRHWESLRLLTESAAG